MIHPGEMLLEEFLRPLGLQQSAVADELGTSRNRLNS
jgi:plasmid maintenance system antidote protein VapI